MIWITVLFSLFITALIVLADMGKLHYLLWLMNSFRYGDKIVHFLFIGVLGFLLNRTAVQLFPAQNTKRMFMVVTLLLLATFTLEEISQGPIVGRDASFADLAVNYAGILTFSLLAYQSRKKLKEPLVSKSTK